MFLGSQSVLVMRFSGVRPSSGVQTDAQDSDQEGSLKLTSAFV